MVTVYVHRQRNSVRNALGGETLAKVLPVNFAGLFVFLSEVARQQKGGVGESVCVAEESGKNNI